MKSHFSATDRTLTRVRSALTGHVRSRKWLSRTLLMLTELWHPASGHFAAQRPVQRPVTSMSCPASVTSVSSFLRDLTSDLVPIFVLGLCLISWVFSCASKVLLMVLIIGSSRLLRPSHVYTLLNYKTITCKFISPIWLCWSSNTKIQSKWA